MDSFHPENHPHRRWNPLLEEWILVSPHRAQRPWDGKQEKTPPLELPEYDPNCYLCPGNVRAAGKANPQYTGTYVFDNDFPALLSHTPAQGGRSVCHDMVREAPETGICRVICFSPRHNLTLAEMPVADIRCVIEVWCEQYQELSQREDIRSVTIFENRGEIMGCSNPHPHGQLWANRSIPNFQFKELESQAKYFQEHRSPMLLDYLHWEKQEKQRIVVENDHFTALVPHWAVWPFETMILPHRAVQAITELNPSERDAWTNLLKSLLIRYDNLFATSFPYSMGIHQKPTDHSSHPGLVFHQHFFPPLLRSGTIKKFQVGYEMSAEPQRDITPEQAAERLRNLPEIHYKQNI